MRVSHEQQPALAAVVITAKQALLRKDSWMQVINRSGLTPEFWQKLTSPITVGGVAGNWYEIPDLEIAAKTLDLPSDALLGFGQ